MVNINVISLKDNYNLKLGRIVNKFEVLTMQPETNCNILSNFSDEFYLKNCEVPKFDKKYWIVENNSIREMDSTEKRMFHTEKMLQSEQKWVVLRAKSYPPIEDFVDAMVKQYSGREELIKEDQLTKHVSKCLKVKDDYPKLTEIEKKNLTVTGELLDIYLEWKENKDLLNS